MNKLLTTVTRELGPAVHKTEIRLTYMRPDGTEYTKDIFAEKGANSDSIQPDYHRDWAEKANWMGNRGHYGSSSETLSFTVAEQPKREGHGIPGFPAVAIIAGGTLYPLRLDYLVPYN